MPLREGDVVTLSAAPVVVLTQYDRLKPHASVTRTLSDDVAGDLAEMQVELRKQVFISLRLLLQAGSDMYDALGKDLDLDALMERCAKEIGDGLDEGTHLTTPEVAPKSTGGKKAAKAKAAAKFRKPPPKLPFKKVAKAPKKKAGK